MSNPAAPTIGSDGFPVSGWSPPDGAFPAAPFAALAQAAQIVPDQPQPTPQAAPTPRPASAPVVEFLTDRPRTSAIPLKWPVKVNGVPYREVVLRRLTMGEVSAFVERVRAAGDDAGLRFPIFYTAEGQLLPDEAWNAFDTDDTDALTEAANDFLPARWKGAPAQPASALEAGAITGSTSQA